MSKISTALRAAALGPAPSAEIKKIAGPAAWGLPHYALEAALDWRIYEKGERIRKLTVEQQRMFFLFVAEAEE